MTVNVSSLSFSLSSAIRDCANRGPTGAFAGLPASPAPSPARPGVAVAVSGRRGDRTRRVFRSGRPPTVRAVAERRLVVPADGRYLPDVAHLPPAGGVVPARPRRWSSNPRTYALAVTSDCRYGTASPGPRSDGLRPGQPGAFVPPAGRPGTPIATSCASAGGVAHLRSRTRRRASEVRNCEGSEYVLKARRAIEDDLAADDAEYAELVDEEGARILLFAGATGTDQPDYGLFSQPGTLNGVPIVIGGKDDPVPVHLQSHDRVHNCRASRELAKSIGVHLFTTPLCVSGAGRWLRDQDGAWTMLSFRIHEYAELRSESPADATRRLQSIDAAWNQRADPLGDLAALREFGG